MPFLSIIIPTHNNEEHIEQAINSCFDSDFDDLEVIVVNDASTDKTEEKIKRLQEQHPEKIKLIISEQQNGLGETRNIGLRDAAGEYIMFLDGDDWYEPYAIQIVAEKLKKANPDVLMFNHQRIWDNGIKSPNIPNKYVDLQFREKDISKPKDRKGAIRNLHSACNKAYNKYHIKKYCGNFLEGFYEDFSWSVKAVTSAEKIHFIPNIIFNYRQRNGSITRSSSNKHFDIFIQISETQKFLEKNINIKQNYGVEIYEYTRSLLFGIIKTGYRIPKDKNHKFIKQANQTLYLWRKTLNISI